MSEDVEEELERSISCSFLADDDDELETDTSSEGDGPSLSLLDGTEHSDMLVSEFC